MPSRDATAKVPLTMSCLLFLIFVHEIGASSFHTALFNDEKSGHSSIASTLGAEMPLHVIFK